jgi:hypothetical protein
MEIKDLNLLLAEFDVLPKIVKEPTYLELCKYSGRRFEEICSQLLCFYLAPGKEHKFKDLFLRSLLELLSPGKEFNLQSDKIRVQPEENAEGKRLDILIHSNEFVIGIENKIHAKLYNPLEIYKNRIRQYGSDNIHSIVLSLKKLSNKEDLDFIVKHDFVNVTYNDYFNRIRQHLPDYEGNCNKKYLYYLNDLIETLENMANNSVLNQELSGYFFDNSEKVERLITLYNEYNNKTLNKQIERVSELNDKISNLTNVTWWAYEGWGLGFNEFIPGKTIGIESYYDATKENPLGSFTIFITAWGLKDWSYFEGTLRKDHPNCEITKDGYRVFLKVATIMNDDEEQILKALQQHYNYLFNLLSDYNPG